MSKTHRGRLCHRLMVPFDGDSVDWPLLSVEFDSLRDQDIDGVFEVCFPSHVFYLVLISCL